MTDFLGLQNHCRQWLQPWNLKTLSPWRKAMMNLEGILKSRDITFLTKVYIVKAIGFPLVMYGCECWTIKKAVQFSSVTQLCLTLRPHGLQHTRPPCPSPNHGVYSNSCPWSWRCHPTISSSAVPFFSCLQPFPASGSFQMSHFFTSGGQTIGVSASASVLPIRTDFL